jgi:D-glycero-D-manno-heptose 1,7-bisphosphate phosphatase
MKLPCIFLDRDGVINHDPGTYVHETAKFLLIEGVAESLKQLKDAGFLLVVVTNQAGIAKGLYTAQDVLQCHALLQEQTGHIVDELYFSPYHPDYTASLGRKPGSLLFEKAIAKFGIDPAKSWMLGDRDRDLEPAKKLGMQTIGIGPGPFAMADFLADSLADATQRLILKK